MTLGLVAGAVPALQAIPGIQCQIPGGAFYAYPNVSATFGRGGINSAMDFATKLLKEAHVATVPPAVLRQMFNHPLTDKGLAAFVEDWKKTGQTIL